MDNVLIAGIFLIVGIVAAIFGIKLRGGALSKKDIEKIRKERDNETERINSMDSADVVDGLDNADNVRNSINKGREQKDKSISDKLGRLFRRIGGKRFNNKDNT